MKKTFIALGSLLVLLVIVASFTPTRALLVAYTLPAAPDWPEPQTRLAEGDNGRIHFATLSPYDLEVILNDLSLARPTTGLGYLSFPAGATNAAPVPAMVILPGSGGITPGREHDYARWFNEQGIAAFVIEYYEPRGFGPDSNYLVRTAAVTEFDLVADAYSALALLASSPSIDSARIGVIGFSYGGIAARLAMDDRIRNALANGDQAFSLHIDVYGPCFQDLRSSAITGAPLLTLRGTEDASNELAACQRREDELSKLGAEVTAHVYLGVGHAWEIEAPLGLKADAPYLEGCEVVYDDHGRPTLNGEPLNDYAIDASHAARVAARFSSGLRFRECAKRGYIVGRDEAARVRGFADIRSFLDQYW